MTFEEFIASDLMTRYRNIMRFYRIAQQFDTADHFIPQTARPIIEGTQRLIGQIFEHQYPHQTNIDMLSKNLFFLEQALERVIEIINHSTIIRVADLIEQYAYFINQRDNKNDEDYNTEEELNRKLTKIIGLINGAIKRGGYQPLYDKLVIPLIEDFADNFVLAKLAHN